jgi:hypothetical protein
MVGAAGAGKIRTIGTDAIRKTRIIDITELAAMAGTITGRIAFRRSRTGRFTTAAFS